MQSYSLFCWVISLIVTVLYHVSYACRIQGYDSGECTPNTDFDLILPFCSSVITYTACLPRYDNLWYQHSALSKDQWVQQMYEKVVLSRQIFEQGDSIVDGHTPWGESVSQVQPRFSATEDCRKALKNYFCYLNFPRCDDEGKSLLMCRSVCENYFKACEQPEDLKRCGLPEYQDGYEPEVSIEEKNGELVYYRFPFPGSPLRDNEFQEDGLTPIVVCTPSMDSKASQCVPSYWFLVFFPLIFLGVFH